MVRGWGDLLALRNCFSMEHVEGLVPSALAVFVSVELSRPMHADRVLWPLHYGISISHFLYSLSTYT
jgi:hypothetical protein